VGVRAAVLKATAESVPPPTPLCGVVEFKIRRLMTPVAFLNACNDTGDNERLTEHDIDRQDGFGCGLLTSHSTPICRVAATIAWQPLPPENRKQAISLG
jgi:hypothetical protein